MSESPGTLELAALELGRTLAQVGGRLGDERALDTFAELGVQFPEALLTNASFNSARGSITTAAGSLASQLTELEAAIEAGNTEKLVEIALKLATSIGQLITSFEQLVGALQSAAPSLAGITTQQVNEFVADLPERLLDLLLYDLFMLVPVVGATLEVFGVIERIHQPGEPSNPTKPEFEKITLHLDQLLPAFTNPIAHLQTLYHWGEAGFDATALLTALDGALGALGLPVLSAPGFRR